MSIYGQRIPQVPDSIRKNYQANNPKPLKNRTVDISKLDQDSLIRQKLLALALNNPAIIASDANIRISEIELKRTKSSWVSSISAGANINEFVIKNSPAASFYPKYNLGVSIPFNIISKAKSDRKVATENVIINKEFKKDKLRLLKTEVLSRYENYLEKKELVKLQKISMDDDYQGYLAAQKNYASGTIELDEMNKIYKSYVNEQVKLITKQKELNIAILLIEEIIGMPIEGVLQTAIADLAIKPAG
jgi:outer membrane protein TolC